MKINTDIRNLTYKSHVIKYQSFFVRHSFKPINFAFKGEKTVYIVLQKM